ncbi:ATP-binding protein [Amycolatopsis eburnea]|uniref:Tetratricopeptide repeat protein n=1 Tax=Amycolatopsis eburnea TaxID=2267691 RepID=A0A3R9FFF3_9PSEU|nr:tetratricopeptide repeat protein [Amycolatopsis eburnea]RSD08496.1 tetratricopeptide repeat protein [Amycolatopsis eburnea]
MRAPDPEHARTVDELIGELRSLKVWAGGPSITTVTQRIHAARHAAGIPESEWPARATVGDCFRLGRRRPSPDLILAVVRALAGDDPPVLLRWRQALALVLGERGAAGCVGAWDRLPADAAAFIGRARLVQRVTDRCRTSAGAVLTGMAGVGKTALAVHVGHRVLAADGDRKTLFADLRGFDPEGPPADPYAVLESFLRLLGVPGAAIPKTVEGRTALYRRRVAETRALVVLDNVLDDRQAEPLLPRAPSCPVLLTSRTALRRLPGMRGVSVPVFTPAESLTLLRRTAGADRVDADPATAARIAALLGRLPLALSIIGRHLRDHPDWPLADYPAPLAELAMEGGVRAAIALSDRGLDAGLRRLLRLLAQPPGRDIDAAAAAALAGQDPDGTRDRLETLATAHLLTRPAPGRYGLHDLVRAYAAERARLDEPGSRAHDAVTRLLDHYRHRVAVAMDLVYPYEKDRRPAVAGSPGPGPVTAEAARDWLDAEEANVVAAAARPGRPRHTADIAMLLWRHLHVMGRTTVAVTLHERALEAVAELGDRAGEVHALNHLGGARWKQGRIEEAQRLFARALGLARETGDRVNEGRALNNLGIVHERQRRTREALACYEQAMAIAREVGDRAGRSRAGCNIGNACAALGRYAEALGQFRGALAIAREIGDRANEAYLLNNIGNVLRRQDHRAEALDHFRRALAIGQELGDREYTGHALTNIGAVHQQLGRPGEAEDCHRRALGIARDVGSRTTEGFVLTNLGTLDRQRGRLADALGHHREALAIAREIGDRYVEIEALNNLGSALTQAGAPGEAIDAHRRAMSLAAEGGERYEQARALAGLGAAHEARDEPGEARGHRRRASALFGELGVPEPAT